MRKDFDTLRDEHGKCTVSELCFCRLNDIVEFGDESVVHENVARPVSFKPHSCTVKLNPISEPR